MWCKWKSKGITFSQAIGMTVDIRKTMTMDLNSLTFPGIGRLH